MSTVLTSMYIDKSVPIPMYYQLKQIILNKIQSGELQPGDCIPTEAELVQQCNISRVTVRQAIMELVYEGHLIRIKRKGTFVAQPRIAQDFMQKLESYQEQMQRLNMPPKTDVLHLGKVKASDEVAEQLGLEKGTTVVRLDRLRYAAEAPLVVVTSFLIPQCMGILELDMTTESLYAYLSASPETKIVTVSRSFKATLATKKDSDLLQISEGSAIQYVKTIGFNNNGTPIEYSIARYVGSKTFFSVYLKA